MRLTLRTLLSYLDKVHLNEEEREAIRQQIESSENASEWIHRTRDVMRRLKLGAPEIDGTGSADDPNTVAEYLDRTLPDESVAEFERVSLESDAMLAEVAACHHVLAMFLAEATDIDPDTRSRLHRLKADLEARAEVEPSVPEPDPAPTDAAPAPEPAPAEVPPRRVKPTPSEPIAETAAAVPDYLRQRRQSELKRWAPAIAALVLLAVTAAIAFLPGGPLNPGGGENVAKNEPVVEPPPPINEPDGTDDTDASDTPEAADGPSDDPDPVAPSTPDPAEAAEADLTAPVAPPGDEPVELGPPAMEESTPEVVATDQGDSAADTEAEPEEAEPAPVPPLVYVGGEDTLAVYELTPGAWRRLTPGFEVVGAVRMVSLPFYRSRLELGGTTRIELVGSTDVTVTPATTDAPAVIDLAHGRLVMSQAAESTSPGRVDVTVDGRSHTLTLAPGVVVAIEGDRLFQPGWPVDQTSPPLVVRASTLSGAAEWTARGQTDRVPMPEKRWLTEDDPAPSDELFADVTWVERLPLTSIEEDAVTQVALMVKASEPIWPQLREIADGDRFAEYRALAGAGSAALAHPDPLIASLRDVSAYRTWPAILVRLRRSMSRSPDQAAVVAQVLEEKYGATASAEQMDLLIGFTTEEIGADAEAVARGVVPQVILPALKSNEIATRVLAGLVLEEVVEGVNGRFDARASSRRREAAIRVIENRLADAELTPRGSRNRREASVPPPGPPR